MQGKKRETKYTDPRTIKIRQESDSGLDVPGQQIPMDVQDICTRFTEENMRMPCSGPNLKKSYLIFENSHVTYPIYYTS